MNAGVPLAEELVPCPDPWTVARNLAHLPHLLFLDSSEKHPGRGRYSYVAAAPEREIPERELLESAANTERTPPIPGLPPFQGGLAGLFGYGFGRRLEHTPPPRFDEFSLSDTKVFRYDWVVAFDHASGQAWIVATPGSRPATWLREVRELLQHRDGPPALRVQPEVNRLPASSLVPQFPLPGRPGVTSNFRREDYIQAVHRAVQYIHAGDCFQVNLSQRLLAPLREHPLELYARLRQRSPAPFGAYFDAGDFQILSASPERFLKVTDGHVETRPIKGTRPRGSTPEADAAQIQDLLASPKDRAENVMIVDLLRNDLGRVCQYGSVRVTKLCEIETFRQVHHLVSEVRGQLRNGLGPLDLLRAAFPGGSVTGAPKVRAMEIIAELEPTARGPYCGSLGFLGFDGTCDTNILIRTMTTARGWVQFPVGGGIVADSDPEREYEETLHKAAGLLQALEAP